MGEAIKIRKCQEDDVVAIAKASANLLKWLATEGKSDYFGGVEESEIREAIQDPSTVIIATSESGDVVGFLLLQNPTEEELDDYRKTFNTQLLNGNALILNGYGVRPDFQCKGIAKAMLENARKYAILKGYEFWIGTVHPKNEASKKAMKNVGKIFRETEPYIHKTKDGRELSRAKFYLQLL